jgi:predicted DNA-binding helix-hairpin-helix protein
MICLALEFVTPTLRMDVVCLLKILLTNFLYLRLCVLCDRKSNDIQRAAFTVDEVVDLTINFTEEIISNILSSGIFKKC